MQPTLLAIQDVFFEAMAAGWAQDVQKGKIMELPGSKTIPFISGDFRVLDTYFVTPLSDKSTGITTIWHKDIPVWIMHYGGWYEENAMSFLKECLHRAYVEEHRFYGGRGPTLVCDHGLTYVNNPGMDDFANFYGEECISIDSNKHCTGGHWYRGMSLLSDN